MLDIFKNAEQYAERVALRDKTGSYKYKDIVKASSGGGTNSKAESITLDIIMLAALSSK